LTRRRGWFISVFLASLVIFTIGNSVQADGPEEKSRSRLNALSAALGENFDSTDTPTGWTVQNNVGDVGWQFDDPGQRGNETTGMGNFAIVDSDNAGSGVEIDSELRTPTIDLSNASAARLTFKTYFKQYEDSKADVDLSLDSGQTWQNVWSTETDVQGSVNVDLSQQAAGQSDVMLRFRYYNAFYEWYWQIDEVKVEGISGPEAPSAASVLALGGSTVTVNWQDNSSSETSFEIERSTSSDSGFVKIGTVGKDTTSFSNSKDVACATTYYYRVRAVNAAGSSAYSSTSNATTPACVGTSNIDEAFTAEMLPSGWSVPTSGWDFNDPQNFVAQIPNLNGGFASTFTNGADLRTPTLNLSGKPGVVLTFDAFFYLGRSGQGAANVDLSVDGGNNWETVWQASNQIYGSPLKTQTVDLSDKAGNQSNVIVRFNLAATGTIWIVDNVKIEAVTPPAAPTSLTLALGANSVVNLSWTASTGATGYEVERSSDGATDWTQITTITNGATSYIDGNVDGNTTYHYRVRAKNAAGTSDYSDSENIQTSDRSVISHDIIVSLYHEAAVAEQNRTAIENNFRFFADAVYEMSNGKHRLGRVTLYTDGNFQNKADVIWVYRCHPNAYISGRRQPTGPSKRIEHCDEFYNSKKQQVISDYLQETKSGGYTLAHEWGHYFYSMYDEYVGSDPCGGDPGSPCATDVGVEHSVMNSQWRAVNGDNRWLNFSTPLVNTAPTNAQYRKYGASAWTAIARPLEQDPRSAFWGNQAIRIYYPELGTVAPAANQAPSIELPNGQTTARAGLDFVWAQAGTTSQARLTGQEVLATSGLVRQLVVDRSSSMSTIQLDDVKNVLLSIVEQAKVGDTIGVVAFDTTATQVQPLLTISGDADIQTIKSAISGITASANGAAPAVGLQTALDQLAANAPQTLKQAVYLISSGEQDVGAHPISVIPAYQQAYVSIYAFGYDVDEAATATLQQLTSETEGAYWAVIDRQTLQKALNQATKDASPIPPVYITIGGDIVDSGTPFEETFYMDSTLQGLEIGVSYLDVITSATFTVIAPDTTEYIFPTPVLSGSIYSASGCEDVSGVDFDIETICYLEISPAMTGTWTFKAEALSDEVDVLYWVDGLAKEGVAPYNVSLKLADGSEEVTYPRPIVLSVAIGGHLPITGLDIAGYIDAPDGSYIAFDLRDDGVAPDETKDDGNYAALLNYTMNGEHYISVYFDNSSGNAKFTNIALHPGYSPDPEGDTPEKTLVPVGENFQRYGELQVTVNGFQEDDYIDTPFDEAGIPGILTVDNKGLSGRIDFVDDSDTFEVTVPNDYTGDLIIRVAELGLSMDPFLYLFAEDYSWEFDSYLDAEPTSDDYLVESLKVGPNETIKPGDRFFIQVYHFDPEATAGTYSISAGPPLYQDRPASTSVADTKGSPVYLPIIIR
ncbi:MAG: VWA domain-containing protein, partial [Chloroflexota bacterium]